MHYRRMADSSMRGVRPPRTVAGGVAAAVSDTSSYSFIEPSDYAGPVAGGILGGSPAFGVHTIVGVDDVAAAIVRRAPPEQLGVQRPEAVGARTDELDVHDGVRNRLSMHRLVALRELT